MKISNALPWMTIATVVIVALVIVVGGVYLIVQDTGYTYSQYIDDIKGLWVLVAPVAAARALPLAAQKLK